MARDKKVVIEEIELGGRKLTLEVGRLAPQATAAVLARYGGTVVLATVMMGGVRSDIDYFPLFVDYLERLYAGGKIKGSRWVKREGRPSDEAILVGRLIDRSIRPLFPKDFKNEVQVVATELSVDGENDPGVLAVIATSAALAISPIPWKGPVGAVRIGLKDAVGLVNPTNGELEESKLDLVVSATKEKVVMLEAGAKEASEKEMEEAVTRGYQEAQRVIEAIGGLAGKVGEEKIRIEQSVVSEETVRSVEGIVSEQLEKAMVREKRERAGGGLDEGAIREMIKEKLGEEYDGLLVSKAWRKKIRELILKRGRIDGRKFDEVRQLSCEVGLLPRTHGSGLFRRGLTHVLSVATLGTPSLEQWIESAEGEEQKRYIHHYSMPPYSVGETGRVGFPKRREIGHGALAEKSLLPVIPGEEEFPYTIRVVSEVMSSNGSTSMGSACASTLALMDAGVPIRRGVAGVAMGLISEEGKDPVILTDIAGIEDYNGDMDFKVAGTEEGVTAVQLDVKIAGLSLELIGEVFERARRARLQILEAMLAVLPAPRPEISQYAPAVEMVEVPVDKIGEVIGPGGRMIRKIIAETGAQVDVEDDGKIMVSGINKEGVKKAVQWVKDLVREVEVGEIFEGTVKRIQPFGVFVEILPGREGLVHVSRMTTGYVSDPNDVVQVGQQVQVRVSEIDELGRTNLSMILDPELEKEASARQAGYKGRQHLPQVPRYRGNRGGQRAGRRQSSHSGRFPRSRSGGSRSPGSSGGSKGDFSTHQRSSGGAHRASSG